MSNFEQEIQKIRDIWNRVDGIKKDISEIYKIDIGLETILHSKKPIVFNLIDNRLLTYIGNIPSLPIDFSFDVYLNNFPTTFIPFCKIIGIYTTENGQYDELNAASWFDASGIYHYWNIIDDNNCILKILPLAVTTWSLGDLPAYFSLKLIIDKPSINLIQADR